ncbi:choice-of-anchor A family protein [Stigmatella sp. ncwal1]|uniref:Choice-of-anchor A family protein n=1 Tax=Stigmatella ashevillensis TaxID=2995309 RepID=A0ABT5D9Z4_9BACT|nr:choice-of-anchor A family protein [Stigmatella ashevillena]MDC0709127.1 choice-of-anchor A family protein [Stigmatella ashevillena]
MHHGLTGMSLAIAGLLVCAGCGVEEGDALRSTTRSISAAAGACGDGNRAADEQCDDGNSTEGDGCSSVCTVENGFVCTDANFSLAYHERWPAGSDPAPRWILSPDRLTLRQSVNSGPAVYMTNLPAAGSELVFDLAVETTSDDDFIGWVVAYDQGDTTNPQAEFMLFDWKQLDQTLSGGKVGRAGLAMSRVKGVVTPSGQDGVDPFWAHFGAISEEARGITLSRTGWADHAVYRVRMEYEVSRVRVWVNNVLQFDQQGTFPIGRFGFYTNSQQDSRFTLVSPTAGSICGLDPEADPDGDGVPTGNDPKPFDPSICGDANGDGIDDCAPSQDCIEVRLSDYNLFLTGNYTAGTDVEGKVAAGGNISMENFSVGWKLPDTQIAQALVAGGNLSLSNGGVWGDAWYGGSYSGAGVTFVRGSASQGTPIDFAARGSELRNLSLRLAALEVSGSTVLESWGGVMLRGTASGVNVFEVPASAFASAKALFIEAPAGSLAVINIRGDSASFKGFGHSFSGGIDQHGVLYNFVDAASITAEGYGFWGTVLAPLAHVTFSHGSFDGGLYARSLTGNAEGHLNALTDRDICP